MNKISKEQIEAILAVVYQTSISAQNFDSLKQLFAKLPSVVEEKKEVGVTGTV